MIELEFISFGAITVIIAITAAFLVSWLVWRKTPPFKTTSIVKPVITLQPKAEKILIEKPKDAIINPEALTNLTESLNTIEKRILELIQSSGRIEQSLKTCNARLTEIEKKIDHVEGSSSPQLFLPGPPGPLIKQVSPPIIKPRRRLEDIPKWDFELPK